MEDKINRETGNYFPFERKTNGNFAARVRRERLHKCTTNFFVT